MTYASYGYIIGGNRSTLNPNTAEFRVGESKKKIPGSPIHRLSDSRSWIVIFPEWPTALEERIGKAHNGARAFPRLLLLIPSKRQKRSRPPLERSRRLARVPRTGFEPVLPAGKDGW